MHAHTHTQEIPKIYLPQLTLKKTTETPEKLSYLDICLQIQGRKFKTSVYDKRDTFNFHIVNFPHLDSNIPSKPAYTEYNIRLPTVEVLDTDTRQWSIASSLTHSFSEATITICDERL